MRNTAPGNKTLSAYTGCRISAARPSSSAPPCRQSAWAVLLFGCCVLLVASCGKDSPLLGNPDGSAGKNLPPYAASKLQECMRDLKTIADGTIETLSEEASLHELTRLITTTTRSYHALNHHVFGWNTTLEHLYRANREAVMRGVAVTRTIILGDDVLDSPDLLRHAVEIMEMQQRDGIKVYYGLQRELEQEPEYRRFLLLDAGLSDDAVYATVKAVSVKGPHPAQVVISWRPETVRDNPFAYLRQSSRIYPFTEQTRQRLLQLLPHRP